MRATNWDINAASNCIGLPMKRAYKYRPKDPLWDLLPCHQIDHNPHYTKGVSKWLNSKVWSKLKKQKKSCNVKGKDIASALEGGSKHWLARLVGRGAEQKGTRHCWVNRHKKSMKGKWYLPFSMHPGTPPPRKPIPNPVPALQALFKLL